MRATQARHSGTVSGKLRTSVARAINAKASGGPSRSVSSQGTGMSGLHSNQRVGANLLGGSPRVCLCPVSPSPRMASPQSHWRSANAEPGKGGRVKNNNGVHGSQLPQPRHRCSTALAPPRLLRSNCTCDLLEDGSVFHGRIRDRSQQTCDPVLITLPTSELPLSTDGDCVPRHGQCSPGLSLRCSSPHVATHHYVPSIYT